MSLMNLSLGDIEKATGGKYIGPEDKREEKVSGVSTDSRKIEPGMLYIPMPGSRADGHDFIAQAFEKGAAAALSEREPGCETSDTGKTDETPDQSRRCLAGNPYILVKSAPQALKDIAEFYRKRCRAKIVGITGSSGKTSTKEMVAAVLSEKFSVLKTEGNFNNEIGMPLTLLRIRDGHDVAVVEMGISDFGEMHRLAKCARPDICLITNIGTAHLEFFGDRNGILRAKTEIFDFLKKDGTVILNGNDDKLRTVGDISAEGGAVKPEFYEVHEPDEGTKASGSSGIIPGENKADGGMPGVFLTASDIKNNGLSGMEAAFCFAGDESFKISEPIPGIHSIYNACAAACVGKVLGMTNAEIAAGLSRARTISGRLNVIEHGSLRIVDDCYNANPASTKASLEVLANSGGRKVAILGDMRELGEREHTLHRGVGEFAAELGIDVIITAGELAGDISDGAKLRAAELGKKVTTLHVGKTEDIIPELPGYILPGDTILVKASRYMKFEKIVDTLKNATAACSEGN